MAPIKTLVRSALPDRWELPARYWYNRLKGSLEPELDLMTRMARPGDVVVDVGANVGIFSYAFARQGAIVHAFEPLAECRAVLAAYGGSRLSIYDYALSDGAGIATMAIPLEGRGDTSVLAHLRAESDTASQARLVEVNLRRLDDIPIADVRILKIDVEGHELQVLRGAEALIARDRPLLLVEIEQRHLVGLTVETAHEEILARGYAGFFLRDGVIEPLRAFDRVRDQERLSARVEVEGYVDGYINNFVFVPLEQNAADVFGRAGYSLRPDGALG